MVPSLSGHLFNSFSHSRFKRFYLSIWLDHNALLHTALVKLPLEYVSACLHHASLSVHHLVIHALRGDIPYLAKRIRDSVSSPVTLSLPVLVGVDLEASLVPNCCGAMQFPVRKLAEAIEGLLFVL